MSHFRDVTADFAVSPQIAIGDLAVAGADGFSLIVNNRPDGEEAGQPSSAEIEAAARAQGLDYLHIPVTGRPTAEQAAAVAAAAAGRRSVAFCRSGTRSIMAWALGELAAGAKSRAELLALAAGAGYDLSALLPG